MLLVRGGIVLSGKSIDRVGPPSQGLGCAVRGNPTPPGVWVVPPAAAADGGVGGGRRGGVLVQVDSKRVSPGTGKVVYHFGVVGCFTCEQVVALFPLRVQAIQSDGNSEFLKDFGTAIADLHLTHYLNRALLSLGQRTHRAQLPHQRIGVLPGGRPTRWARPSCLGTTSTRRYAQTRP